MTDGNFFIFFKKLPTVEQFWWGKGNVWQGHKKKSKNPVKSFQFELLTTWPLGGVEANKGTF